MGKSAELIVNKWFKLHMMAQNSAKSAEVFDLKKDSKRSGCQGSKKSGEEGEGADVLRAPRQKPSG